MRLKPEDNGGDKARGGAKKRLRVSVLLEEEISSYPFEMKIVRVSERCSHCGACTAVCPSGALYLDRNTREVGFERGRCVTCELCVRGCPLQAVEVLP